MALARARAFQEKQEKQKAEEENRNLEQLFQLKVIKAGDAVNFPKYSDSIAIHYSAYLEDGTCFDNSSKRGQPLHFILGAGQVISGIEMILPLLSRGTIARLVIPPEYAYGDKGFPPIIPPKSTVLFELELLTFSSIGSAERILRERRQEDPFAL
eukprot:gene4060-4439_t